MAGKGNPKGTNNGGGRKPRLNASRHNVLIDNKVWKYLNRNGNVSQQIEQLARDKMNENLVKIAETMYRELSGADNKQEHAELVNEIYDWLANGDAVNLTMDDVPDLVKEWREYEGQA